MARDKTISETLFEAFCRDHGIVATPIARESLRTPDYHIDVGGHRAIVEVKQIEPNADDRAHEEAIERDEVEVRSYPIGKRVRQEITDGKRQIRNLAKGRCPGLLVLYNNVPFGQTHTDPMMILLAMYGQLVVDMAVPADKRVSPYVAGSRFGGSRSVTQTDNTSLSAIGVLHDLDHRPALTFYHNSFAEYPFEPDWLRSRQVHHYGVSQTTSSEFRNWVEV